MFDDPTAYRKDLSALIEGFVLVGLDREELLQSAEVNLDDPVGDAMQAQVDAHMRLWAAAAVADPRPALPLLVGMAVPFGAYGVVDYLGSSSLCVASGMRQLERFFGLITDVVGLRLVEESGRRGVEVRVLRPLPGVACFGVLYTLGVTVAHLRYATPAPLEVSEVWLTHPPSDPTEFEAALGGPVRFGALRTVFFLSDASWDAPCTRSEPALHAVLERHALEAAARRGLGSRLIDKLWPRIARLLRDGQPTLDDVALHVAMSARTLQRRLKAEGTSFSELVDRVRQSLASRYLSEQDRSVAEVAWLLGYSDASAFVRAFERWTGMTPGRFRSGERSELIGQGTEARESLG